MLDYEGKIDSVWPLKAVRIRVMIWKSVPAAFIDGFEDGLTGAEIGETKGCYGYLP